MGKIVLESVCLGYMFVDFIGVGETPKSTDGVLKDKMNKNDYLC
jgi:hypothetical protein